MFVKACGSGLGSLSANLQTRQTDLLFMLYPASVEAETRFQPLEYLVYEKTLILVFFSTFQILELALMDRVVEET